MDAYVSKKQCEHEEKEPPEDIAALPIEKLHAVVQYMFQKCYRDGTYEHAMGVALEAKEADKVLEILDQCAAHSKGDVRVLYSLLVFGFEAAMNLVSSKAFRFQIVQVIAEKLEALWLDSATPNSVQKACAFGLANAHQVLRTAEPVAKILKKLLDGSSDDALLGLQLCFDLVESGDQNYVNKVAASLTEVNAPDAEGANDHKARYEKATKVLTGGFSSELAISFLHKNSDSDPLIMENLKSALEQRSAGRNSVLHNCAVLTHSYLNAGTTNDAFLRDNLEWMKKASNW